MEPLWTEQQYAEYRDCSVSTVQKERVYGGGCPYVKLGRQVRYRPEDARAWIADRVIHSTSEAA